MAFNNYSLSLPVSFSLKQLGMEWSLAVRKISTAGHPLAAGAVRLPPVGDLPRGADHEPCARVGDNWNKVSE